MASVISIRFVCYKQKTAYEMRISDWSADVCSSDLREVDDRERGEGETELGEHGGDRADHAAQHHPVHAERVQDAADEIERADAPQPTRRSEAKLDEREQDQHDSGVFDELAVRAHPTGEEVVSAVADQDFLFRSHAAAPERLSGRGVGEEGIRECRTWS